MSSRYLALDLVLLGEISASLLSSIARKYDLNLTQCQILCLLEKHEKTFYPLPMAPQQMSRKLGVPATRVVSQLKLMGMPKGLVQNSRKRPTKTSDRGFVFYELTLKGRRLAEAVVKDIRKANTILVMAISRKNEQVLASFVRDLRGGLATDAFKSANNLDSAFKRKQLPVRRNGTHFQRTR